MKKNNKSISPEMAYKNLVTIEEWCAICRKEDKSNPLAEKYEADGLYADKWGELHIAETFTGAHDVWLLDFKYRCEPGRKDFANTYIPAHEDILSYVVGAKLKSKSCYVMGIRVKTIDGRGQVNGWFNYDSKSCCCYCSNGETCSDDERGDCEHAFKHFNLNHATIKDSLYDIEVNEKNFKKLDGVVKTTILEVAAPEIEILPNIDDNQELFFEPLEL